MDPQASQTRQQIIQSLFSRRGPDGSLEETYIAHLKVWEDAPDDAARPPGGGGGKSIEDVAGKKARYLMLAVSRQGRVFLHKAKRNANMTFSKGKTWNLEDLRVVEMINSQSFALTMTTRAYVWQTERPQDQLQFMSTLVRVYTKYTQGKVPHLINFEAAPTSPVGGPVSPSKEIPPPLANSETLAPPRPSAFRDRQDSASSLASSNFSGGETYYTSRSGQSNNNAAGPSRPSIDSNRSTATTLSRPPIKSQAEVTGYSISPQNQSYVKSPLAPNEHLNDDDARRSPTAVLTPRNIVPNAMEPDPVLLNTPQPHADQSSYQQTQPLPPPPPPAPAFSRADRSQLTPIITTTGPSPQVTPHVDQQSKLSAAPSAPSAVDTSRAGLRRASFVPPPAVTSYSRDVLLRKGKSGASPERGEIALPAVQADEELEDETLANVEEMLEGFDWGMDSVNRQASGAGAIEARLLDELNALEAANIHAFLENDDRINTVLLGIDEAISELDQMDSTLTSYKVQLNSVTEDISYIESQNRGLQVQTTNQRALLQELEQLLENVQVSPDQLQILTQESLESERGIQNLESALATLYKALAAVRDRDVGAAAQRMSEYENYNKQFCLRLMDFLVIMFKYQTDLTLQNAKSAAGLEIPPHSQLEDQLGKYCGLILYMKEMDEDRYQKLCAEYFSTASGLHNQEFKLCFTAYINKLRKPVDSLDDGTFAAAAAGHVSKQSAVARSKTVITNLRGGNDKKRVQEGEMRASEAFAKALEQVALQISREEAFIADFLQITDSVITYADYMDLDHYFRRQATKFVSKGPSPAVARLHSSALDLIFGFVGGELKDWVEGALQREKLQIFGILATCEHFQKEAQAGNSLFFMSLMDKLHQRVQMTLDRFLNDQVKVIEATKLTVKKRTGIVYFVRHFPAFVESIEAQLVGCEDLDVRKTADNAYERIANTIFDTLTTMAKQDRSDAGGGGDDKSQLNYLIIMIENMQIYAREVAKRDLPVLAAFQQRAQAIYDENLSGYVKAVLRRSFGKQMDFFDGIQRQLRASPRPGSTSGPVQPSDIPSQSTYSRSNLKRITKDAGSPKDLRKAVDALSKRVEKHFTFEMDNDADVATASAAVQESQVLIKEVWTALERWLVAESRKWGATLQECYGANVAAADGFEWGPSQVEETFRKVR